MYFGCSRDDPKLMAAVARLAAEEPLVRMPDAAVHVTLTVGSDITFTVEDDLPPVASSDGRPRLPRWNSVTKVRQGPSALGPLSASTRFTAPQAVPCLRTPPS